MSQAELDALDDEAWAELWQDLLWVREEEAKFNYSPNSTPNGTPKKTRIRNGK